MSKNKSILATVITVIGGIVVALISNADKITLNFTNVINKYALIPGIILFTIWLIYILTNKFKRVRVENHPIFTQFIYWNHYVESVFELENKGKELVFRELLQGNLNIYKDRLCKLHDDTKNIHNIVEFKSKHLHIFYGILHELENYFSEKNYSKSEMEVLNLVIPKYNKWCTGGYDLFLEKLEEICSSDLYKNNTSRNIVILLSYQIMISIVILNSSKTLGDINGELAGKVFRGVEI